MVQANNTSCIGCRNQQPLIQSVNKSNNIALQFMVYFWTYAHPSYCPSDLLARGFTAAKWTSGRSARPPSLS